MTGNFWVGLVIDAQAQISGENLFVVRASQELCIHFASDQRKPQVSHDGSSLGSMI